MRRETNRERILRFLEENDEGFCDDCLSALTGVRPRQQVRQICTLLAHEGTITRTEDRCTGPQGEKGKLVSRIGRSSAKTSEAKQVPKRDIQIIVLVDIHTKMNKALDRLDDSPIQREFFAQKLARLKGRGIIDPNLAEMMFMINRFRNRVVKEGERLDGEEWTVLLSAIALVANRLNFPADHT